MSESRCIINTRASRAAEKPISLCGKELSQFDWTFSGPEHAVFSGLDKSAIYCCPGCGEKVVEALKWLCTKPGEEVPE